MQINDFVTHYQSKSDEELLQLAADSTLLTPEAHSALAGELTRRRLGPTPSLKLSPVADQPQAGAQAMHGLQATNSHSTGEFITEVLRLYRAHWRLFLMLVAPAVAAGYVIFYLKREMTMEIARRLFYGQATTLVTYVEMSAVGLAGSTVSWMAFSCAFGAICFSVRQIQTGNVTTVAGSFAAVRQRSVAFVRISLLLFLVCIVLYVGATFALSGVVWLASRHVRLNSFTFWALTFALTGGALLLLSRFALAIPAVVLDNFGAGKAMFRSDELTEGKWLTLLALLSKSVIGGYVAGMCPYWLASWLLAGKSVPFGLPWFLAIASAAAVTSSSRPCLLGSLCFT